MGGKRPIFLAEYSKSLKQLLPVHNMKLHLLRPQARAGLSSCLQRTEYEKGEVVIVPQRLCKRRLHQVIGVTITVRSCVGRRHPDTMREEGHFTSVRSSPETYGSSPVINKTSDNSKLRNILWNTWLVLLNAGKVMKNKGRLRNCRQPEETQDMTKCHVVPWMGSWKRKGILVGKQVTSG